jgi:mono/diheme cytochrome c family protein
VRWTTRALAALGGAAALAAIGLVAAGISARPEPSRLETKLARGARHLLIPAAARALANPVPASPEAIARGRAHFADHCATCHGNDGKGGTSYGRRMFPRAPDMTLPATQELSDGELFWIVEHGVRLTGMPGFGDDDPANDAESWELVHFLRTLPRITSAELVEMERLNPTLSRAAVEHERELEEFLAGGEASGNPEGHRH